MQAIFVHSFHFIQMSIPMSDLHAGERFLKMDESVRAMYCIVQNVGAEMLETCLFKLNV